MEQQLYELLRQCTVRVSVSGKTGHGTGFFVAPGLILTCAHVVKAAQSDTTLIEVYWNDQRYPAQIIERLVILFQEQEDMLVLTASTHQG